MSKALVLAEKPSVARDIARVLKATKRGDGYLEGNDYIITWALGHLVTLADPEQYDKKYKTWNLEDLPIIPKENKLVIIPGTKKQYYSVKNQMSRKDVSEIIIATDAGREGELVARCAEVYKRALHIAHTAGEFAYYVKQAEKELAEERKDD